MSVGDFINGCNVLLEGRLYEPAMSLGFSALDATARKDYPALNVQNRCEHFIRDHYDILTAIGTGNAICSVPGSKVLLPDPRNGSPTSLETFLYGCIRCCVTHETALPQGIFFNEKIVLGKLAQGYSIPVTFIYAIALAVVGAKSNGQEQSNPNTVITIMGQSLRLTDFWGQKGQICSLLGIPYAK